MIVVPSISPVTISAARPRRRARLRRPSRSRIRWRSASTATTPPTTPSATASAERQVADGDAEEPLHHATASTPWSTTCAVDHADDAVGGAADREVVGDDQQRQAALDVEPAQQRGDLLGVGAVEVAGRLVGPHDRGVVDERAGDRHALALAAGELVGHVAARGRAGRPARAPRARAGAPRRRGRARPAAAARRSRPPSGPASGCSTGRRSPSGARGSRCAGGRTSPTGRRPRSRLRRRRCASRPERQFSSVVLPQPLGPITATISPRASVRSMPRSASTRTLPVS